MLQKINRLPASVKLSQYHSLVTPRYFLKVSKNALTYSRFGFVVSKKTAQQATERNRIRRVFRSCIEEMLSEIVTGYDMLFLLKAGLLEIERKDLYDEVHKFFLE